MEMCEHRVHCWNGGSCVKLTARTHMLYVICCEPLHHVVANLVTIRIGHERTSYVVSLGHARSSSAVCCIPSICGPRAGVIHRPAWCIHACGHDLLQEKATRSHRAAVPYCCLCDGEETLLLYASSGGGVAIFLRKRVYMMSSPRWRPCGSCEHSYEHVYCVCVFT